MPDRERALAWTGLAEEDLRAARVMAREEPPLVRAALNLSQQAAEKALKGLIAARGAPPPRTHDLVALLDLTVADHPPLERLRADALLLNPYAVHARYPGDATVHSPEEVAPALEAASRIVADVLHELKS